MVKRKASPPKITVFKSSWWNIMAVIADSNWYWKLKGGVFSLILYWSPPIDADAFLQGGSSKVKPEQLETSSWKYTLARMTLERQLSEKLDRNSWVISRVYQLHHWSLTASLAEKKPEQRGLDAWHMWSACISVIYVHVWNTLMHM